MDGLGRLIILGVIGYFAVLYLMPWLQPSPILQIRPL